MSKRQARKAVKAAKKYPKIVALVVALVLIIVAVLAVMYFLKLGPFKPVDDLPVGGNDGDGSTNVSDGGNDGDGNANVSVGSEAEIASSDLSIHFLELGNKYTGDCTLIKCGDTEVLIDAGSRQGSAQTIKSYLDKYCTDGILEYVIATHAHRDHISGFVGNSVKGGLNTGILYQYKIDTLIQFSLTDTTTGIYESYVKAVEYAESNGTTVYTASQCYDMTDGAQRKYYLDGEQKVSINILYNYYYYNRVKDDKAYPDANENDYSVCMLLQNERADKTYNYLFTGDLEESGEKRLVEYYKNSQKDFTSGLPEVDLFKGGHHGSYTASNEELLRIIKPKNVAVCCCCGTTEFSPSQGHEFPAQEFIDRVSKYTANIYCTTLIVDYKEGLFTSMNGNIVFYYDGELKLYCSNNTTVLKDTDWFKANRTWNGI